MYLISLHVHTFEFHNVSNDDRDSDVGNDNSTKNGHNKTAAARATAEIFSS
jgi:hypothetical protein